MKIIGCMSGTSLDGLDLAFCEFSGHAPRIEFKIISAKTFRYHKEWKNRLKNADQLSGLDLQLLDQSFGAFTGELINQFIQEFSITHVDYIASHGHTIFHRPELNFTLQIGSGLKIAKVTNIPTIYDFRTIDVLKNGQGAPLVPIGDELLFHQYQYCLNLGGFSNISFHKNGERLAFDISPANLILNYFAEQLGHEYDKNGALGEKGQIDDELLKQLNRLSYYEQMPPKSLGKEWLEREFMPLIDLAIPVLDIIRTLYEHIGFQIGKVLSMENSQTLVTGGGAFNSFLMGRIQHYSKSQLIILDNELVNFKEALIFAFLGYLRVNQQVNILKTVTGADSNSCSGIIALP